MRRGLFAWQHADIAYDDITIPAACKDGQVDHVGPELQHRAGHIPQSAHMTLARLLCDGPECSDPTCANDEWPREYLPKFKWNAPVVRSSNCTQTHETAMPGHDAARTETVCVVLHALRGRGTGAHMRTVCWRLGTLATACMLRVNILRVCTCARGVGRLGVVTVKVSQNVSVHAKNSAPTKPRMRYKLGRYHRVTTAIAIVANR